MIVMNAFNPTVYARESLALRARFFFLREVGPVVHEGR